ncbi:hypothetical protein GCM10011412_07850 [Maribacter cobaltidurans]|nr:hypothetical protein GCM10011412_07850 [Maribacter cobaltidurans]
MKIINLPFTTSKQKLPNPLKNNAQTLILTLRFERFGKKDKTYLGF